MVKKLYVFFKFVFFQMSHQIMPSAARLKGLGMTYIFSFVDIY